MYYIPSCNKGNQLLIYQNYKFWMNNRLKNRLSWSCSSKKKSGCTCRIFTSVDGRFMKLHSFHNHKENWDSKNYEILQKKFMIYNESSSDWIYVYFKNLEEKYECVICKEVVLKEENIKEKLSEHLEEKHVTIFKLHKKNDPLDCVIEFIDLGAKSPQPEKDAIATWNQDKCITKKKRSWIWKYFERVSSVLFRCMMCQTTLTLKTLSSYTNMKRHIRTRHAKIFAKEIKKQVADKEKATELVNEALLKDVAEPTGERTGKRRCWAWKYFKRVTDYLYSCTLCETRLSIKNLSSNNMKRHIRGQHSMIFMKEVANKEVEDNEKTKKSSKQVKVDKLGPLLESIGEKRNKTSRLKHSWIWDSFERVSDTLARCKLCEKVLSHCGGSTGNLNRHMKVRHNWTYASKTKRKVVTSKDESGGEMLCEGEITDGETVGKKRCWIWKYFKRVMKGFYRCTLCQTRLSIKDFSTNNMKRHIRTRHSMVYFKETGIVQDDNKKSSQQLKVEMLEDPLEPIGGQNESSFDWIYVYYKELEEKYECIICREELLKDENIIENLSDHLQVKHLSIFLLHKNASHDDPLGFRIDFLDLGIKTPKRKKAAVTSSNPYKLILNGKKRSWVWKYFERVTSVIFRCTLCQAGLSIKGFNTNNMNRHIRTRHPKIFDMETSKKDVENEKSSQHLVADELRDVLEPISEQKGITLRSKRSWIWDSFDRVSDTLARCKICERIISHGGGATGNLNRHMKLRHNSTYASTSQILTSKDESGFEILYEEEIADSGSEDYAWIWKLFSLDDENNYSCKICHYKCEKEKEEAETAGKIIIHLRNEHGVISGSQIISDCATELAIVDECTTAVDYLKDAEVLNE